MANQLDNIEFIYTLGLLHLQNNQADAGKRYLTRMLKEAQLEKERNTARYFIAQAEEQQEHWQQALAWYQKLTEGSHYFIGHVRSILIYVNQQRWQEAIVANT